MVDDIFRISWELSCIIMLGIIDIGKMLAVFSRSGQLELTGAEGVLSHILCCVESQLKLSGHAADPFQAEQRPFPSTNRISTSGRLLVVGMWTSSCQGLLETFQIPT